METIMFLQELSNCPSVSGYETIITSIIVNAFKGLVDDIKVDKLGNVIALKKGLDANKENPKIMLAAHMDEIGLMVTDIEDNGFLRFTNIGGIDPRTIVGQEVIVHGRESLSGVIGSKPPHLQDQEEKSKAIPMKDMIIDLGLEKGEVDNLVNIGDVITINREFKKLKNNRVYGKSLDNEAGVASLYECAKELQKLKHESDVYFVFTVQEEVTMAGAIVSTYSINPDIGIAVDVGFGSTPELPKYETLDLDEGPGVTLGGNIHPTLRKKLIGVASDYNIKTQVEVEPGPTGTDGRCIQITRDGISTLVLSIPLRYMHTSVEVISMNDVSSTAKLLAYFINSINIDNLEGLLCY